MSCEKGTLQGPDREMSQLQRQAQGETRLCRGNWARSGGIWSVVFLSSFGAKVRPEKVIASPRGGDGAWERNLHKRWVLKSSKLLVQAGMDVRWAGRRLSQSPGGEPGCRAWAMRGRVGWKARGMKSRPPTRQSAQLCEPKPCRGEPSAWLMLLQIR